MERKYPGEELSRRLDGCRKKKKHSVTDTIVKTQRIPLYIKYKTIKKKKEIQKDILAYERARDGTRSCEIIGSFSFFFSVMYIYTHNIKINVVQLMAYVTCNKVNDLQSLTV